MVQPVPNLSRPSGTLTRVLGFLAAILILVVGSIAADRFAQSLQDNQRIAQTQALKELASTDRGSVQSALRLLDESLSGLRAYLASVASVDPGSFAAMTNETLRRNPALRSVGYATEVNANAPQASVAAAATDPRDASVSGILERNWFGDLVPAAKRERYMPITTMISVAEENENYASLVNFDLLSNASIAPLLANDQQSVSYQSLVPGRAMILLPAGSSGHPHRALLAEVEIQRLLSQVGTSTNAQARVYDASDASGLKLLYPSATNSAEPIATLAPVLRGQILRNVQVSEFDAIGRKFRVETSPLSGFFSGADQRTATYVRIGGIIASALAALLLLNLITRNARIEKLVDQRGQELSQAYEQVRDSELMSMQAEKMSSLGQMVAGVAHEINTPLAFATSNVELLNERMAQVRNSVSTQDGLMAELAQWQSKTADEKNSWYQRAMEQSQVIARLNKRTLASTGDLVDESLEGLNRVRDLVATLKDFSRVDRAPVDDIDIHQCIENTLKVAHNAIKHRCEVVRDFQSLPHVRCNPSQLNQVLLNLVSNAAQAMTDIGEIKISTRHSAANIEIDVADNGSGMSEQVLKKIFQPFYTTKASGEGTGLGLAICEKIIKAHGGTINVVSEIGRGTTFTISLPIAGPPVSETPNA